MVDIIYILLYLAQVLNHCRVHSASLMLAELHNEHYTFMSFNKKLMLTYILLIECILIVNSTLLHLALLWGLKYHKVHRNSQKINNSFFCSSICCYPAFMAPPQLGTITTNICIPDSTLVEEGFVRPKCAR